MDFEGSRGFWIPDLSQLCARMGSGLTVIANRAQDACFPILKVRKPLGRLAAALPPIIIAILALLLY